jgi:peroxiredoxin
MIKVGDKIPAAHVREVTAESPKDISTVDFFAGKKVALFGLPGAFTSTCSAKQLPSFAENADALHAKGVDLVVCTAVNDAAVMKAWSEHSGTVGKVMMLADGNAEFAKAMGLEVDQTKTVMGIRSRRYSMLVDDGTVKILNLEEPGAFGISSGDHLLMQI